jgi:hypothetical protein
MSNYFNQYTVQTCAPCKVVIHPDGALDVATYSSREFGTDVDVPVLDIRASQYQDTSFRWDEVCFIRNEVDEYKRTCERIINGEDNDDIKQHNIETLMQLLRVDLEKLFRISIEDVSKWNSIEWYTPTFSYQQHDIVLTTFDEKHANFLQIRFKQDVVHVKITCEVEFQIPNFDRAWEEWNQQRFDSLIAAAPAQQQGQAEQEPAWLQDFDEWLHAAAERESSSDSVRDDSNDSSGYESYSSRNISMRDSDLFRQFRRRSQSSSSRSDDVDLLAINQEQESADVQAEMQEEIRRLEHEHREWRERERAIRMQVAFDERLMEDRRWREQLDADLQNWHSRMTNNLESSSDELESE